VTLFFAWPSFLRVYTKTTFPSFYFSDEAWRKLRKLVSPAFSSGTLDVYFDVFKDNSEILVQTLMAKVGAGEFDVCRYLNLYTLDCTIGEYIKCYLRNFQGHQFCFPNKSILLPYIHFVINGGAVPPLLWCPYVLYQICAVHNYSITYLC